MSMCRIVSSPDTAAQYGIKSPASVDAPATAAQASAVEPSHSGQRRLIIGVALLLVIAAAAYLGITPSTIDRRDDAYS